jgi:hypothetical protein
MVRCKEPFQAVVMPPQHSRWHCFFLRWGSTRFFAQTDSEWQWIVLQMGISEAVGIPTRCHSTCCDTAWEASGLLVQPCSFTLLTLLSPDNCCEIAKSHAIRAEAPFRG